MSITTASSTQAPGVVAMPTDSAPVQYLTFTLGGEAFAIGILTIKEIIEYREPTAVPMAPPAVCGVINLRGAVVPVMDPRVRFGQASSPVGKRTCIVIVEVAQQDERQVIGVLVDAVNEVIEIPAAEIEPPPSFGARIRADFIQGIGKVRGKFVIVLDVERVLSANDALSLSRGAVTADTTH